MTAIANASVFQTGNVRQLTTTQLDTLRAYEKGLGYLPLDNFFRFPPAIFPLSIGLPSDPNNTTVTSLPILVPFDVKCWGIDLGCVSAAGATCTGDIQRKPVGGAFASVFPAAKDIKTAAGAMTRFAPESGSELWKCNDQVELIVVGGGAGAVLGARATLWLQPA